MLGLKNYLTHHLRACLASLGSLVRTPFASLMTAVVIGPKWTSARQMTPRRSRSERTVAPSVMPRSGLDRVSRSR